MAPKGNARDPMSKFPGRSGKALMVPALLHRPGNTRDTARLRICKFQDRSFPDRHICYRYRL